MAPLEVHFFPTFSYPFSSFMIRSTDFIFCQKVHRMSLLDGDWMKLKEATRCHQIKKKIGLKKFSC